MQHNLQKTDAALMTLNRAIDLDPANPLCKFHRASVFLSSERLQEALDELLQLKQMVPNESLVFFLLGKVRNVNAYGPGTVGLDSAHFFRLEGGQIARLSTS